jgi:hypothetical protein
MELARRELPDGQWLVVYKMIFTAKLTIGPDPEEHGWFDDSWCYENEKHALIAMYLWNGEGEPEGWHRHPHSGRRRPGGDPSLEYINK